jgi:aspartyl-tRNA(Asn)/glutamyl-tRNA(Gln) amidotransferase subunit A
VSELYELSGHEVRSRILRREVSAEEVTRSLLERISKLNPIIHAYVTVDAEGAVARAKEIDSRIADGEKMGELCGIPIAVKDNICTLGMPTTCSSRILENFSPPYEATVVEAILEADAVILGKTNLDEFAMGSSTENSAFGTTRNPWDTSRIPGGSSGGSAAAIAADLASMALGSDTGGSIRQPAALCGVVGLKPTYGRVSRYGLVAFGSSLDQIGPITKDVFDAGLLLNVIARHDPKDSTSAPEPTPNYVAGLKTDMTGVKIGLPSEYFGEGLSEDVESAVRAAAAKYEELGAEIVDISLPHTEYAVATYYIIATAEACSNLSRYDGVHYGHRTERKSDIIELYSRSRAEGFGPEVKRRIMLGTHALSAGYYDAYYLKAAQVRALFRRDFDEAFEEVDVMLCPTSPTPAFKIGEKASDPLAMYLSDIYTISANLAGIPGISMPCGISPDGLPIGMQLMAGTFDDEKLLRVAYAYEQATDHHLKRPAPDALQDRKDAG